MKVRLNVISFSIYLVISSVACLGLLDYYYQVSLTKHENATEQANRATELSDLILRELKDIDLGFRGYYILPNQDILRPFNNAKTRFDKEAKDLELIIKSQGYDLTDFNQVKNAYINYIALIDQLVKWKDEGNIHQIDSVFATDPGYDVWVVYDKFNQKFEKFEQTIIKEGQEKSKGLIFYSRLNRLFLIFIGIPTLLIVLVRLKKERKRRSKLFSDLEESNRRYLFDDKKENAATSDESIVISDLIQNLQRATTFISEITSGNFKVKWEGLSDENEAVNENNLAGELLKMRNQMIKVKQDDEVRIWLTEGTTKFSELVRQHQDDISVLTEQMASEIVKYLNANQAYIFITEEDSAESAHLKLYSCYAYNRKKYLNKTVLPGEGLVGQVYQEGLVTHLTQLPANYAKITSGLGEATPTNLIIIPLKYNEKVEGVMEIASFTPFEQYKIGFLEKVGEITGSAIVSVRSKEKMRKLMENLQVASEEMKAQEEEMRQNMEELQATQEEMSRKAKEYQQLLAEKNLE